MSRIVTVVFALFLGTPICLCVAQSMEFGSVRLRPGMPADSALELAGKEFQLTKLDEDLNLWIATPMGKPSAGTYGSLTIVGRKLTKVSREFSSEGDTAEGLLQALLDALRVLPLHKSAGEWSDLTPCTVARLETLQPGGKVVQMVTFQCGRYDTTIQGIDFEGRRDISVSTSLIAR